MNKNKKSSLLTTNYQLLTSKGFTLIEMLLTLAIMGIVFGFIFIITDPMAYFANQRNIERESDLRVIMDAIDIHRTQNGGVFSCVPAFKDVSENGNDSSCLGGECPTPAEGRFGSGVDFDGNNQLLEVVSPNNLDIEGDISLSIWLNPSIDSSEFPSGWNYFLIQEDDLKYEFGFLGTSGPRFRAHNSVGNFYEVNADVPFGAGEWYNVTAVREGSFVGIYINGTLEDSRNDFSGNLQSGEAVRIGGNGAGAGWNGVIDSMFIYNRALSSDEVQNIHGGIIPENPVLQKNFSDPASTVPATTTAIASESEGGFNIAPCLVPNILRGVPFDPGNENAFYNSPEDYNSGYTIIRNESTGQITIQAPSAELENNLEIKR